MHIINLGIVLEDMGHPQQRAVIELGVEERIH